MGCKFLTLMVGKKSYRFYVSSDHGRGGFVRKPRPLNVRAVSNIVMKMREMTNYVFYETYLDNVDIMSFTIVRKDIVENIKRGIGKELYIAP